MRIETRNNRRRRWAIRVRSATPVLALALFGSMAASAQPPDKWDQILNRLDRLEQQNKQLAEEVHALRQELATARVGGQPESKATPEERLEVQENRTAELAQTKVEASQRFPIRVTGMVLANSYFNSGAVGGAEYPTTAVPGGVESGGGTLRQTVIGLDYNGPKTLWDGKVSGSLRLDLFGGSGEVLAQTVRLRTADIRIDWNSRSIFVGVDKPLISPREPDSLAQVGVSPLSGAGNLWLWLPQARFEQDFHFGRASGLRAQVAAIETSEQGGTAYGPYAGAAQAAAHFDKARPGVEGRLEIFTGTNRRLEVAPGFHHSVSQVGGTSVPSDIFSLDWFARPWRLLESSGAFFDGQNVTPLGTGAIRQGIIVYPYGAPEAVHSRGGWGQLTFRPASRLWFNIFSGQQDDRNSDLFFGAIGKNLEKGANVFYRLAPNVLTSFEVSRIRTSYIGGGALATNHYDLALAYLF